MAAADKHGKESRTAFRTNVEYALFSLLYKWVRSLSLRRGYALSKLLMRMLFRIDFLHARRTVSHILHAGVAQDREQAVELAKRSFEESGKLIVEIAKCDQLFKQENFIVNAPEATRKYLLGGDFKGMIMVTAHYGNWELAGGAIATALNSRMTSLMRHFSNPKIGELFLRTRATANHVLVDKRRGVRPLLKALHNHEIATMLIDQHASGREGVVCEFFGHPARVHMTPALLHLRTGIPILPEVNTRLPGEEFRFEMTCGELIRYTPTGDKRRDVALLTQKCISALEELIRRHPEQWLWAPRHWLDIDRSCAAEYADWKPGHTAGKDAVTPLR